MYKAFLLMISVAIIGMMSGCALVGTHVRPEAEGTHVTVGLISIEAISDGYPMIPLYNSFKSK